MFRIRINSNSKHIGGIIMRFLKTLTLNRRAIYDSRVALNTDNTFTVADSNAMVLPKSNGSLAAVQTDGMIRYNTTTDEVEVYSGVTATWRTLRYKESTKIIQQSLGPIDGYSYYYGPLNAAYDPTKVSSENDNFNGQNIFVFIENVFQIYNTNYVITQNPTAGISTNADSNNGATTLSFADTSTIPSGSIVTGSPYLQSGTVATVVDGTTVSLSLPVSGGNILAGTPITFNATGYYLNFTSDPNYASMITKPITVLHGFDR
jgi:hypothetical protein